jgi:hypothetical protein
VAPSGVSPVAYGCSEWRGDASTGGGGRAGQAGGEAVGRTWAEAVAVRRAAAASFRIFCKVLSDVTGARGEKRAHRTTCTFIG